MADVVLTEVVDQMWTGCFRQDPTGSAVSYEGMGSQSGKNASKMNELRFVTLLSQFDVHVLFSANL